MACDAATKNPTADKMSPDEQIRRQYSLAIHRNNVRFPLTPPTRRVHPGNRRRAHLALPSSRAASHRRVLRFVGRSHREPPSDQFRPPLNAA